MLHSHVHLHRSPAAGDSSFHLPQNGVAPSPPLPPSPRQVNLILLVFIYFYDRTCSAINMNMQKHWTQMSIEYYQFGPHKIDAKDVFYTTPLSFVMVNLRPVLPGTPFYLYYLFVLIYSASLPVAWPSSFQSALFS